MKIIQSYWSLPSLSQEKDINGRSNGGFLDARFNYMSWALSCLSLKRFYKDIELITDEKGKELLINTLKLPYTKVTICLDELNHYHPKLWAIGKIKAYQLQKEPFLHVDGDVFIWKKFGDFNFENKGLIVQNFDYDYPWYHEVLSDIENNFSYIPKEIVQNYSVNKNLTAINAGIIGGTDIDFFQQYTYEAFEFVNRNLGQLDKINVGLFNNVFEQYLFYAMAQNEKKDIHSFLNLKPNEEFTDAMTFNLLPNIKSFIHLIGFAKRNVHACEQVEMRLRYEFPEYYERVCSLFDNEYFPNSNKRYKDLKSIYEFMEKASVDDILKVKFNLSSNVEILVGDNINTIEYTQPQTNEKQNLELKDWNSLLEAFEEPTSAEEVLEVIGKDTNKEEYEKIKMDLIDFLTDKLMYNNILEFA
jgi:hypothetical protein